MIDKDGYPYIGYPDRCSGCGTCEMRCPDFAINLQEVPVAEDNINETNFLENSKKDEQKSEKVGS